MQSREAKEKIRNWLLEFGFSIKEISASNTSFNFEGTNGEGRKLNVLQESSKKDEIQLGTRIVVEQWPRIDAMDIDRRNALLWNLRLALINLGVGFMNIDLPLEEIQLHTSIFYDGLTKDRFMFRLFLLRRAIALVSYMIGRELQEPPPRLGF